MFGIGSTELLVIFLVALVVLGPKSLPGIAKTLGKVMGEFRRVTTEFQRTMNVEVAQEEHEKRKKEAEEELFGSGRETASNNAKETVKETAKEAGKETAKESAKHAETVDVTATEVTPVQGVDATSGVQTSDPARTAPETAAPETAAPETVPLERPQEPASPLAEAVARAEAEAAASQKTAQS